MTNLSQLSGELGTKKKKNRGKTYKVGGGEFIVRHFQENVFF